MRRAQPHRAARGAGRTEGQALVEWVMILPIFLALCMAIAFFGWLWWNQVNAAAAVHDGTALAAAKGGSAAAGLTRMRDMLRAGVGPTWANQYQLRISGSDAQRSVIGWVRSPRVFQVPFLGPMAMRIQAGSFQRLERFYGGPPASFW